MMGKRIDVKHVIAIALSVIMVMVSIFINMISNDMDHAVIACNNVAVLVQAGDESKMQTLFDKRWQPVNDVEEASFQIRLKRTGANSVNISAVRLNSAAVLAEFDIFAQLHIEEEDHAMVI